MENIWVMQGHIHELAGDQLQGSRLGRCPGGQGPTTHLEVYCWALFWPFKF